MGSDDLDVEMLIGAVKVRPCLWDITSEDYKNRLKRKENWTEEVDPLLEDDKSVLRELISHVQPKSEVLPDKTQNEMVKEELEEKSVNSQVKEEFDETQYLIISAQNAASRNLCLQKEELEENPGNCHLKEEFDHSNNLEVTKLRRSNLLEINNCAESSDGNIKNSSEFNFELEKGTISTCSLTSTCLTMSTDVHLENCTCSFCLKKYKIIVESKINTRKSKRVESKNKGTKPIYSCDKCDKVYHHKRSLTSHLQTHFKLKNKERKVESQNNGTEPDVSWCKCNKVYHHKRSSTSHLETHYKKINNQEGSLITELNKPLLECNYCQANNCSCMSSPRPHVEETHDSSSQFICDYCDAVYNRKGSLRSHILNKHLPPSFKCEYCSKLFNSWKKRYHHAKTKHGINKLKLNMESIKKNDKKRKVSIDKLEKHTGNIMCQCLTCKVKYKEMDLPKKRVVKKIFSCEECMTSFQTMKKLHTHLETHSIIRKYICDICPKAFNTQHVLNIHVKGVHGAHERNYKCGECCKTFISKTGLKLHYDDKHVAKFLLNSLISCNYCNKKFSKPQSMQRHMKQQHSLSKEFICDHCLSAFATKGQIFMHMLNNHLPPTLKCSKCSEMFTTSDKRLLHLRYQHRIDKRQDFMCEQCGKSFKSKNVFDQHFLIHTSELPFCCSACGKKFRTVSNLNQHLRIHSDKRMFSCNHCSKAFKIKHHLRQHMAVHGLKAGF